MRVTSRSIWVEHMAVRSWRRHVARVPFMARSIGDLMPLRSSTQYATDARYHLHPITTELFSAQFYSCWSEEEQVKIRFSRFVVPKVGRRRVKLPDQ